MFRKDYIVAQIEEMAKFMTKLLATLSGLAYDDAVETVLSVLAEKGLKIDDILEMNESDLIETIEQNQAFDSGNIEALARIFEVLGDKSGERKWYSKSLFLLDHINTSERIFSSDRNTNINRLKSRL
ncbi:hypothetical protein [Flavobacterium sp.]|uniref:hypothetical protein n=1 Tax=Flavobacterium sp. TaxID=239 RepID=UPI00120707B4|nr:hypothetical protein [Flavobacterium sp.]RZJ69509.1 MAG: hypothetical protein EOO49_16945 [Flavobacterium sp.]